MFGKHQDSKKISMLIEVVQKSQTPSTPSRNPPTQPCCNESQHTGSQAVDVDRVNIQRVRQSTSIDDANKDITDDAIYT